MEELRNRPKDGKRPLEFAVHRVPFFLEPGYDEKPPEFEELHETRMLRKWGGPERFEQVKKGHRLAERGAEVGIVFNEQRVVSNTMASHCLVQWVSAEHGLNKAEELYSVLNRIHFIEGTKLNAPATLAAACEEIGINGESAMAFLTSQSGKETVLKMTEKVHSLGIHSIPTFIVAGEHLVSGAERSEAFIRLFRDLEERMLSGGEIPSETVVAVNYSMSPTL